MKDPLGRKIQAGFIFVVIIPLNASKLTCISFAAYDGMK
jgi:hypothetical protein